MTYPFTYLPTAFRLYFTTVTLIQAPNYSIPAAGFNKGEIDNGKDYFN